jgi:hypothetical protein
MQCCAGFRQPADIFTVQALRMTDPQIRCVRAQCARRAAAQVGPDTGTSAHAHTICQLFQPTPSQKFGHTFKYDGDTSVFKRNQKHLL